MKYLGLLFLKSFNLYLQFFDVLKKFFLFLRHGFVFCLQQERPSYHTKTKIPPCAPLNAKKLAKKVTDKIQIGLTVTEGVNPPNFEDIYVCI